MQPGTRRMNQCNSQPLQEFCDAGTLLSDCTNKRQTLVGLSADTSRFNSRSVPRILQRVSNVLQSHQEIGSKQHSFGFKNVLLSIRPSEPSTALQCTHAAAGLSRQRLDTPLSTISHFVGPVTLARTQGGFALVRKECGSVQPKPHEAEFVAEDIFCNPA